jgi:hypothetical protein
MAKVKKIVPAGNEREMLKKTIQPRVAQITTALTDAATGMWVEKEVDMVDPKTGKKLGIKVRRVYQKDPDVGAGQYLLNQVVGKPKETTEVQGQISLIMDI